MGSALGRTPTADVEDLFISAVPDIDRAVAITARRSSLSAAEAEDLASDVKLRLIENDYAALRNFDGRSSLRTYVVTIVSRLLLDRRRKEWGRFRPSSSAIAHGPLAERLERLLYCDGLSLEDALDRMCAMAPAADREALLAVAQALPVRPSRRTSGDEALAHVPAPASANPEVSLADSTAAHRAQTLIEAALHRLPAADRILIRLRFEDGISVAEIARMLRQDQKKLYRQLEQLLRTLRDDMSRHGLVWRDVEELIERGQCHIRLPLEAGPENVVLQPSLERAVE